jgi:hypothetical protein
VDRRVRRGELRGVVDELGEDIADPDAIDGRDESLLDVDRERMLAVRRPLHDVADQAGDRLGTKVVGERARLDLERGGCVLRHDGQAASLLIDEVEELSALLIAQALIHPAPRLGERTDGGDGVPQLVSDRRRDTVQLCALHSSRVYGRRREDRPHPPGGAPTLPSPLPRRAGCF